MFWFEKCKACEAREECYPDPESFPELLGKDCITEYKGNE